MNKKVVLLAIACLPLQIHSFYTTQESPTGKATITLERDQYSSGVEQNTKQTITIDNKTDKPVIISFYVNGKPDIGYRGMLVKEYKVTTLTMPQFYWFTKQAVGGYRKPGQPSQVRTVDVLNHALADGISINVPDDQLYIFSLQPGSFTLTIE